MEKKGLFFLHSEEDALKYYARAQKGFNHLISIPDNKENLEDELKELLDVSFQDITMQNKEIHVFWFHENVIDYIIEIFLTLLGKKGEKIGEYVYVLDAEGNVIDDRWTFDI